MTPAGRLAIFVARDYMPSFDEKDLYFLKITNLVVGWTEGVIPQRDSVSRLHTVLEKTISFMLNVRRMHFVTTIQMASILPEVMLLHNNNK